MRQHLPEVLRQRGYRRLWIALIAMSLAAQMIAVAVGWQVYEIRRNPLDLGLIGLAEFVPLPLLALPAGQLADRLSRRLRKAHRVCRSITLRLRFDDFSRATRSHTVHEATALTETILATGRGLLTEAMPMIRERGITLIGLTLSNLSDDRAIQLALPLDRTDADAMDVALDRVKERFGSNAVTRAVLLGRDQGVSVPLLPD